MAEANRNDPVPITGSPEEVLTPDEQRPRTPDVQAAIDAQFGDDPDSDDEAGGRS